jgi:branched-chain amino acid transport system ATP-binding protein
MKALEVENLNKRFGGLTAVRDISFSVSPGEILGLIGPNGSGKSTVMKAILGVERPSGGSVKVRGVEVAGRAPHEIARLGVGMVFQHSRPLHRQTVLENIALALTPDSLFKLWPDRRTNDRAREIAGLVGLADKLDAKPAALPYADSPRVRCAASQGSTRRKPRSRAR